MRHFVSKFKEPQLGVAFTIETSVPSIPYFQFNSIKNSTKMQIAFISTFGSYTCVTSRRRAALKRSARLLDRDDKNIQKQKKKNLLTDNKRRWKEILF